MLPQCLISLSIVYEKQLYCSGAQILLQEVECTTLRWAEWLVWTDFSLCLIERSEILSSMLLLFYQKQYYHTIKCLLYRKAFCLLFFSNSKLRLFIYHNKIGRRLMDRDAAIYQCNFELFVQKATVSIKFPCVFFLQWKTANGKKTAEGKNRPTSLNNQITFQETLELTSELIFDNSTKQFAKKETMINLNLISKARQDQSKLVGRVVIDLSTIANYGQYNQIKNYKLAYCSVDGEIMFSAVMRNKRKTNMSPQDLDKSSFNEYLSFYSGQKRQQKQKKDQRESFEEETSIGYGRKVNQNAIDLHQNTDFRRNQRNHQTFFVLQSPKQNPAFNLTSQMRQVTLGSQQRFKQKSLDTLTGLTNFQTDQMQRVPSFGKEYGRLSLASRNGEGNWEHDKIKFRDEIENNKHKIEQMQKKIMELYNNLQDSKRHIEFSQRQNRQKEEIIKLLKNSIKGEESKQQNLVNDWKEKFNALEKEASQQNKKYKTMQQNLRRQLHQNQLNFQNLRKQTQQLRKIWSEKKEHYEEKLKKAQQLVKERQNKINELCLKNQEFTKFKYQNDLLKVLSEQKQSKIKLMQRDFLKLSQEINEIKKNNLAQQNYKLKLQNAQSHKSLEDLTRQFQKCQAQIQKYRQNYIKIQTAYQIQNKTYESTKEKYSALQNTVFGFQKENIQLRNSVENDKRTHQELEKKYIQLYSSYNKVQGELELLKTDLQNLKVTNDKLRKDKDQLISLVEKHKIEDEVRKQDFEKQLKRVQLSFVNRLENKEKVFNAQKKQFQSTIAELKQLINSKQLEQIHKKQQYQAQTAGLKQQIELYREQLQLNLNRIKNLQQTILDKQQIIKLSKQEIESLKATNNDLYDSLSKMRQTEKQLQQNIMILEEQSQKIIYILEQKQETDRQIEVIRQKIKEANDEQALSYLKIKELEQLNEQLIAKNEHISRKYEEVEHQKFLREEEIKNWSQKIQELNMQHSSMRQEWVESKAQIQKLKQIIKDINQRYQEHIKNEQRYVEQLNYVRQEKQEIEVMMNKNINQLAFENQQLRSKIIELQNQIEKFQSCMQSHEQEKRGIQSAIQYHEKLETQQRNKEIQLQVQIGFFEGQITKNQKLKLDYKVQIQNLNDMIKQLEQRLLNQQTKNSLISTKLEYHSNEISRILQVSQEIQASLREKVNQITRLQAKCSQLQREMTNLLENRNTQPFSLNDAKEPQTKSIFSGEQQFSQRQHQLQQLLLQSDRKNQALQSKIMSLSTQLQQVSRNHNSQDIQQIYSSFNQFQRQEMAKIIEEQRIEIERIQAQLKKKSAVDSSALQKRIVQLQNHIVQLQSSFKLELDRIMGDQFQREGTGLTVITEENSQDEMYKSERSLVGSPSRVKSSLQMVQMIQIREKLQLLLEQKRQLQQQFNIVQQEKFNFLSTINQKDIELQQLNNLKFQLQTQNNQLRVQLQKNIQKCRFLEYQSETLKNQLTFGSTINFNINENSVTKSQPALNFQSHSFQNKNIEIENLKVQIDKYKNRQEELVWNIKDLEMQLQTVTQSLNLLNASGMNSVLNSNKNIQIGQEKQEQKKLRGEQGYSKEKLLLQLKKNEELKEISHNLIRVLKQRSENARDQQIIMKDKSISQLEKGESDAINNKVNKLLTQFQTIKVYVMKSESQKLKEEAARMLGQKNIEIMKNILVFEQQLKSIRSLSENNCKIDIK